MAIHPYEDGNGRIARALSQKSIMELVRAPVLLPLSQTIAKSPKEYYQALASTNHSLDATEWILYFCKTMGHAQHDAEEMLALLQQKTQIFNTYKDVLNPRQEKVLRKLFDIGPGGFKGGLSAENYRSITKATASSATRDLRRLVELKILQKRGERRGTRYWLSKKE